MQVGCYATPEGWSHGSEDIIFIIYLGNTWSQSIADRSKQHEGGQAYEGSRGEPQPQADPRPPSQAHTPQAASPLPYRAHKAQAHRRVCKITAASPHVKWQPLKMPLVHHEVRTQGFSTAQLPLPGDFVGIWLGDGNSKDTGIASICPEIHECLKELAAHFNESPLRPPGAPDLYVAEEAVAPNELSTQPCYVYHTRPPENHGAAAWNPVRKALRELNLLGNKGDGVPLVYREGSPEVVAAVIGGLIDTDGCLHSEGGG